MRQIKEQALRSRQSPLDKGFQAAEQFLKYAATAQGVWQTGKAIYGGMQAVAPYAQAAGAALSLL